MNREFRLSPHGGRGVSCDANGVFFAGVSLLQRTNIPGTDRWEPRDCEQLSEQLGLEFGLPMDVSKKAGGLKAICNALNQGDVARAQVAAVLLALPEPPTLVKNARSDIGMISFIRDLHWSGLIKSDWDSEKHPRWPADAPESQGGQFAPQGEGESSGLVSPGIASSSEHERIQNPLVPVAASSRDDISRNPPGRKSEEECERQYDSDLYVCGSLRDKRDAAACRSSAAQRYAACLRGKHLPPLTLPEPDYDFQPVPVAPQPYRWQSGPPPWLPLLFIPFLFGVPA